MAGSDNSSEPRRRRRVQAAADPDRYLEKRSDGRFRYRRRVPARFAGVDPRAVVKCSLYTDDLALARRRRDAQEVADNEHWCSLLAGVAQDAARAAYQAASARARALGFAYISATELAATAPLDSIVARLLKLEALGAAGAVATPAQERDVDALLGTAAAPATTISEAFDIYFDRIEAGQKTAKSPSQYRSWRKVKTRARDNFITVIGGDKPVDEITRADAQAFHKHWQARIDDGEVSANSANRDLGNMRRVFADYMRWIDRPDAGNPFRNLSFSKGVDHSRPPFETAWLRERFLVGGAWRGLNPQARDIVLAMIETGCRPSEIANLTPSRIRLDHAVPHISIAPERGLEIKTRSSIRDIPLIGVSLEALQRNPQGFPRYFDKPNGLSQILMKFMRSRDMLPTPAHKVYSLRHSFKKRCEEGGVPATLIYTLMGHMTGRPLYGDGGSLEWRRSQIAPICLPYDPDVFDFTASAD